MLPNARRLRLIALPALLSCACAASPSAAINAPPALPAADVASAESSTSTSGSAPAPALAPAPAPARAPASARPLKPAPDALLIYDGKLALQSDPDKLASTLDAVVDAVESAGGHIAGRTDSTVTVKVPSARFRETFSHIETLATVLHRAVSAEDVTEQCHDLEVRLANLRATRQRIQEFLAHAANVGDMLTLERELERVASEIDVLEGKLRFLKEHAAFSTITVEVSPRPLVVKEPPPPPPPPVPPAKKRAIELPVSWLDKLGMKRLLDLR